MKLAEPGLRACLRVGRVRRPWQLVGRLGLAAAVGLLAVYRRILSPWLAGQCGWGCRFEPSCSHYATQALRTHGFARGLILSGWRLMRCNPLGGRGYDPVPPPSAFRLSGAFWTHES